MLKEIYDLDFSSEVDVLYAYNNFVKYPEEITKLLKELKIKDYKFGCICFRNVEQICLWELNESFEDKEIEELLHHSLSKAKEIEEIEKTRELTVQNTASTKENQLLKNTSIDIDEQGNKAEGGNATTEHFSIFNSPPDQYVTFNTPADPYSQVPYSNRKDQSQSADNATDQHLHINNTANQSTVEIQYTQKHEATDVLLQTNKQHPLIDLETQHTNETLLYTNQQIDNCNNPIIIENTTSNKLGDLFDLNKTDPHFHIKHAPTLLKPLINVCNKKLVDLIYCIYRKTGISHFDFLYEEFKDPEQKIELHLLFAKDLKLKSFDFSEVKEVLEDNSTSKGFKITPKNNSLFQDFGSLFESKEQNIGQGAEPIIPLPFTEKDEDGLLSTETLDSKPFRQSFTPNRHLEEAEKLLLQYDTRNSYCLNFYLDCLASFLCLKFSKKVLERLLALSCYNDFPISLNRINYIPYFFYKNANIARLLESIPRPQIDPYKFTLKALTGATIKVNCYLLQKYLQFTRKFFSSVNAPESDYLLIANGLKSFVAEYRSVAFFKIFTELLSCKVPRIHTEIKKMLSSDLELYLRVFYNNNVIPEPEAPKKWSLSSSKFDSNELTIEDDIEDIINALHNTGFYQEKSDRISKYLLYLYYKEVKVDRLNRTAILNDFLLETSLDPLNKVYILDNIDLIKDLMHNEKEVSTQFEDNNKDNIILDETKLPYNIEKEDCSYSKITESINYIGDDPSDIKNTTEALTPSTEENNNVNNDQIETKAQEISIVGVLDQHTMLKEDNNGLSVFDQVFVNLQVFPEFNWRYKKAFILMAGKLEKLGITKEWIKETFLKDKVFYIRKMMEDL